MRIAFVSDAIYPYHKGGKEKRLYEMSTRLAKKGFDVHVYCMHWWDGPEKDRIENGVYLHAISKLYPLYTSERRSIKEGILFGLACLKLVTKNFDVLDVDHMPIFPIFSCWVVAKLKNKKMIAVWNEVWGRKYWVDYMGLSGNIAALLEWMAVRLPDNIVSISSHTTKRLVTILNCKTNIIEIPVGVDLAKLKNVKPSNKHYDVMFAGRLLSNKRVDLLIKAVANLKNEGNHIKCLIIGEGPEKKNLEFLSKKIKVDKLVDFLGFLEKHDDVYSYMKSSSLFIFPSEREGFGIVVIEANACGTSVITNSAEGNAAKDLILDGYNGFIFKDVDSLADSIKQGLIQSNQLRSNCIKVAKPYDWANITSRLAEIYK